MNLYARQNCHFIIQSNAFEQQKKPIFFIVIWILLNPLGLYCYYSCLSIAHECVICAVSWTIFAHFFHPNIRFQFVWMEFFSWNWWFLGHCENQSKCFSTFFFLMKHTYLENEQLFWVIICLDNFFLILWQKSSNFLPYFSQKMRYWSWL